MLASLSELRSYAAGDLIVKEGGCNSVEPLGRARPLWAMTLMYISDCWDGHCGFFKFLPTICCFGSPWRLPLEPKTV